MGGWPWSNYLAKDNLALFARLWQKMAMRMTLVWFLFFLVGGGCWFTGMCHLRKLPDDWMTFVLLCALLSSAAFGLAALLYAGIAVASVAHSTQKRLAELENRLAKLESAEMQGNTPQSP